MLGVAGSKIQTVFLGDHLLLTPTIMTSLWKLSWNLALCVQQQTMCWLPSGNHQVCTDQIVSNTKLVLQTSVQPRRNINENCCFQISDLKFQMLGHLGIFPIWHQILLFSAPLFFSPTQTPTLLGRFPLGEAWMHLSLSKVWSLNCKDWVKWEKSMRHLIMIWFSKVSSYEKAPTHPKRKVDGDWLSLCAEAWGDRQEAASVSLRQTDTA